MSSLPSRVKCKVFNSMYLLNTMADASDGRFERINAFLKNGFENNAQLRLDLFRRNMPASKWYGRDLYSYRV